MAANIYLIGYRGTGKTTVARLLAEHLGWSWCDADVVLEEQFGRTIREIFETEGEPGFRDKESQILAQLSVRDSQVIATGGGVVLRPENRLLLQQGRVIWLKANPATIWQRLQEDTSTAQRRPNLAQGGLAEVETLLRQREPLYQSCAELTVDTSGDSPQQVVARILQFLHR